MKILSIVLLFYTYLDNSPSIESVTVKGAAFRQTWMEIGTVSVPSDNFVSVTGTVSNFTKPHIVMGVPRDGNSRINSGYASCTRVKSVTRAANRGPKTDRAANTKTHTEDLSNSQLHRVSTHPLFTLGDQFGDLWGGFSRLFVMDDHHYAKYAPSCTKNPLESPVVCFDSLLNKNGDSVTATMDSDSPFPWEIWWQVNVNGTVYTGGAETTMTFTYYFTPPCSPLIVLTHSEHLVDNNPPCNNCSAINSKGEKHWLEVNNDYRHNDNGDEEGDGEGVYTYDYSYAPEDDYFSDKENDKDNDNDGKEKEVEEERSSASGDENSYDEIGEDDYGEGNGDGNGNGVGESHSMDMDNEYGDESDVDMSYGGEDQDQSEYLTYSDGNGDGDEDTGGQSVASKSQYASKTSATVTASRNSADKASSSSNNHGVYSAVVNYVDSLSSSSSSQLQSQSDNSTTDVNTANTGKDKSSASSSASVSVHEQRSKNAVSKLQPVKTLLHHPTQRPSSDTERRHGGGGGDNCPCIPIWLGRTTNGSVSGNVWYNSNNYGRGTEYFISAVNGYQLLTHGTLCSGNKNSFLKSEEGYGLLGEGEGGGYGNGNFTGINEEEPQCSVCLRPGEYLWRVTGALDVPRSDEVAWSFCDVRGGSQTQLTFTVDDYCHCIPNNVTSSAELCRRQEAEAMEGVKEERTESLSVSLEGVFLLEGLLASGEGEGGGQQWQSSLSEEEAEVLQSSIAQEMSEALSSRVGVIPEGAVTILEWTRTGSSTGTGAKMSESADRRSLLLSDVVEVTFGVTLSSSVMMQGKGTRKGMGIDMGPEELVSLLLTAKSHFRRTMSESGLFLGKLRARSHRRGTHSLTHATRASLLRLELVSPPPPNERFSAMVMCVGAMLCALAMFVLIPRPTVRIPCVYTNNTQSHAHMSMNMSNTTSTSIDQSISAASLVAIPSSIRMSSLHRTLTYRDETRI
eukprot:gene2828-5556_t